MIFVKEIKDIENKLCHNDIKKVYKWKYVLIKSLSQVALTYTERRNKSRTLAISRK